VEAYHLVLNEAAAMTLAGASRPVQRRLGRILDEVKSAPFRSGDLQQIDEDGRTYEVVLFDDWLVSFWSDHAVREIRVVNLQRVED
jgi:hypothetical protein